MITGFVSLYQQLKVITSFSVDEQVEAFLNDSVECNHFAERAWLLQEASLYLRNPFVRLRELLGIPPTSWSRDNYQMYVYEYITKLFSILPEPPGLDNACTPFLHPDLMPELEDLDRPIPQLFQQVYGMSNAYSTSYKQYSHLLTTCKKLMSPETCHEYVSIKKDLIRMDANVLFSTAMTTLVMKLGDEIGDSLDRHLYFLFFLLILLQQIVISPRSLQCEDNSAKLFFMEISHILQRCAPIIHSEKGPSSSYIFDICEGIQVEINNFSIQTIYEDIQFVHFPTNQEIVNILIAFTVAARAETVRRSRSTTPNHKMKAHK
jgi:hypothetical protein